MKKERVFLNAAEFNKAIEGSKFHNCFAAAMSITKKVEDDVHFNLKPGRDIGISFEKICRRYGFKVKEVHSLEEAKGKYAFLVLGWFPVKVSYFLYYELEYIDFHVIRVNPDGTVLHKADFKEPAMDLPSLEDPELWDYREELRDGCYRVFILDE